MRLIVIGDIHGELHALNQLLLNLPDDAIIIQCGDFGIWPSVVQSYGDPPKIARPIYFIDGNHEYFPWLTKYGIPTEIWPNLTYVPRGTVLELAGKRVGFLGGGDSFDKDFRTPGMDWFPEETIKSHEAGKLVGKDLDVLITHSPPSSAKYALFGFKPSPSEDLVEWVWNKTGRPDLYCGHMHPDTVTKYLNVTVIPIEGHVEIEVSSE